MKKMKTLFEQDDRYRVIDKVRDENEFIYTGSYAVYRKRDGTSVMIKDGVMYKRYDANERKGRKVPEGAIPCQKEPGVTGSFPVWVKVDFGDPSNKHHVDAFKKRIKWEDGTYELCGPKVNGNKEKLSKNILIKHDSEPIRGVAIQDYNIVKDYLESNNIEGLVIKDLRTGVMTKIRRKDFGFEW